jgi:hypothetical protein
MKVFLKHNGRVVAIGTFQGSYRKDSCSVFVSSTGMSSIMVDEVFDGRVKLYYDLVLEYLEEAKGVCIAWPIQELSQCAPKAIQENPRNEWLHKKVFLISEDSTKLEKIAIGFVSLVGKDDVVNFQRLGEEHVGVTVMDVYKEHSTFSTLSNGQIQLLSWPINRLQWENGESLVGEDDFPTNESLFEEKIGVDLILKDMELVNKKKRRYSMVNRSVAREGISKSRRVASTKCSWKEVLLVAMVECCKRRCCQHAK